MKRHEVKKVPLSDSTIKALEPEDKEYSIHDGNGLYFRVRPNGNKDWRFRYKNPVTNKMAWKGLGGYPKVSGRLARVKAQELREKISNGENIAQAEILQSYAFIDLVDEWLVHRTDNIAKSTHTKDKGKLYRYAIPVFGNRDYRHIAPAEWLKHFQERQKETGYIETINRVSNLCSQVYSFAILIKKTMKYNPIDDVSRYLIKPKSQSYPHVELDEIGQLMRDIQTYQTEQGRYALMLLAMFFCRPAELVTAQWKDFDFDKKLWSVDAEKTKTGYDVLRPIPTQAIEILNKLKIINGDSDYILPSARDRHRHATVEFLEKALHRLGYKGKHSPHGFRHVASTYMNAHTKEDGSKFDERVIEFALSHKTHGIKGKYNKTDYLKDRIELNQWYANELYRLMNKK